MKMPPRWICPDCATPIGYLGWALERVVGVGPALKHPCERWQKERRQAAVLETKELTAKSIMAAYEKHKGVLLAQKSAGCGHLHGEERIYVANEMVLLRNMLIELGFTDENMGR